MAELIKDSVGADLKLVLQESVTKAVGDILHGFKTRLDTIETSHNALQKENAALVKENAFLRESLISLNTKTDDLEQYTRRNSLRVAGIAEKDDESTDMLITNLCSDLGVPLETHHIDRSHRVGKPDEPIDPATTPKPRPIIVKFISYRYRQQFYRARYDLKNKGHKGVFVNEDLTKYRNNLLYKARMLVKDKKLKNAWSSDGSIFIKDNHDERYKVLSVADLACFI